MSWLAGWKYRNRILIDHTKIDADLIDFPALVSLSATNFDFTKALSTGYDIRLTSSNGITLLSYERELHDSVNSLADYWVKIPSISSTVDTVFYMYYGNASAADGANPTAVWDSNFKMVQHMNNNPDNDHIADSTINANNGTKYAAGQPLEVNGEIAKAQSFNSDSIGLGTFDISAQGSPFSVSMFIKTTQIGENDTDTALFVSKRTGTNTFCFNLSTNYIRVSNWESSVPYSIIGTTVVNDNIWHFIEATWDGTTTTLYVDGNIDASAVLGTFISQSVANGTSLGAFDSGTTRPYVGIMDEVRTSDIVRSASWIKASYNSENNTLQTIGQIEDKTIPQTIEQIANQLASGSTSKPVANKQPSTGLIAAKTGGLLSNPILIVGLVAVALLFMGSSHANH